MKVVNELAVLSVGVNRQKGAVLIVSLIILLVLTVVVLSANQEVVIQERSTAAIRESNLVFQAAETALRDAEEYIDQDLGSDFFDEHGFVDVETKVGLYNRGTAPTDYIDDSSWEHTNTIESMSVGGNFSARFFIEELGEVPLENDNLDVGLNTGTNQIQISPTARFFRIVVRAQGINGVPRRLLAGYYSAEI